MKKKTLEERIELLEYYNNLLRDFATDPESYVLWDYIMSEELNGDQGNQLMDLLREHYTFCNQSNNPDPMNKERLVTDLVSLMNSFGRPANERTAHSIIRRAAKHPIFPLYSKYL